MRRYTGKLRESEDHEVSMAITSLDTIIKNAIELRDKIGSVERNLPGWIQDHIVNSENYIEQANSGFHELKEVVLKEGMYPVYHNSFSSVVDTVIEYAKRTGYEIDPEDWQMQVALGGKYGRSRPSVGKTHSFTVGLFKGGKLQRKALHFQVYGLDSGRYELNAYIG